MKRLPNVMSTFRFLRHVGAFNIWFFALFIVCATWMSWLHFAHQRPSFSDYLFLFLVPLGAGTGLMSAAKRGDLDLLFGAGETRSRVWRIAFLYAFVAPVVMAIAVFGLADPQHIGATALRLAGVVTLTAGVGFSAGMLETRYFAGVVWLLLRLVVLMAPQLMVAVKQMEAGVRPPLQMLGLAAFLAPETMLDPHMPPLFLVAAMFVGCMSLMASHAWFVMAEFPGRRD